MGSRILISINVRDRAADERTKRKSPRRIRGTVNFVTREESVECTSSGAAALGVPAIKCTLRPCGQRRAEQRKKQKQEQKKNNKVRRLHKGVPLVASPRTPVSASAFSVASCADLSGDGVKLALSVAGEESALALLLLGDEVELLQLLEDVTDDTAGGGGIVRAAGAVRLQASIDAGELTHTDSTAEVHAASDGR